MEREERYEGIPLTDEAMPYAVILLMLLSFLAGFLYRKVSDAEDIADAYEEGFNKGADVLAQELSKELGIQINLHIGEQEDD